MCTEQYLVILVSRVHHAVAVILFPFGWQQSAYPGALSFSLFGVEDDDQVVHRVVLQCARQHPHEPPSETLQPELPVFGLHGVRQLADVVCHPVPWFQLPDVVHERIEISCIGRIDDRLQEISETLDSCQLELQEYGVETSRPHGPELSFPFLLLLIEVEIFQSVQYHVPSYVIMCL